VYELYERRSKKFLISLFCFEVKENNIFIHLFIYLCIYLLIYTKIISSYRDPRGFAIKFYSDNGIWDLAGTNSPIFFIRDPMLFPSFIHLSKRNPVTNIKVRIISELQLQNIHFLKLNLVESPF
jgi:hypothetical protein